MSRRQQMWCVVHFTSTPTPGAARNEVSETKHHHQHKLPSSCFSKRISSASILLSSGNVFLVKAAFRNGPESSAVTIQIDQSKVSGSLIARIGGGTASPSARLAKRNRVVCCFKFQIENKSPSFCKVFSPPLPFPFPPPPLIYILVLGLTQFLQEFFFHLPKLDTHRHFSYELFTAFLGNLLAVPQVNMTDISTAFEEGQALVSNLIAVCREEETT